MTRDEGNADAPGSSSDRNAEADGCEIPRLLLYADLTYFPDYIDKSTHETQVLGTHLGLSASIGQSTTRTQVMTRG